MRKKIINGFEILENDFERVSKEYFDSKLDAILSGSDPDYTSFVEVERFDDIDFVSSDFTYNITDGQRFAFLNVD